VEAYGFNVIGQNPENEGLGVPPQEAEEVSNVRCQIYIKLYLADSFLVTNHATNIMSIST
jgi:hypothetical protein